MRDINFERQRVDRMRRSYSSRGINPQTSHLTYLAPLIDGQGVYEFQINRDRTATSHVIERYLQRNDMLIQNGMTVCLYIEPNNKPGHGVFLSFPQTGTPLAGYGAFTTADIEALYNGSVNVQTGNVTNFRDIPMHLFRKVPKGINADFPVPMDWNETRYLFAEEMKYIGTRTQVVRVSFATVPTASFAVTTGFKAYLALVIDGWLLEGGTTLENLTEGNEFAPAL